jgi:hypothetical protein
MWERLRIGFGPAEESSASRPVQDAPPDPPELAHPGNRQLFDYFRQNSCWNATAQQYETRAHSDLAEILFELVADPDVRKGHAYGRPVVANRHGLIFAWAGGTGDFFVRLIGDKVATACGEGARSDPTYPPEWINFYMSRLSRDWRKILQRWARISYEETLAAR